MSCDPATARGTRCFEPGAINGGPPDRAGSATQRRVLFNKAGEMGNQLLELLGMQEHAHLVGGTIEISGVAGMGTTITARVTTTKNSGGD